MQHSPKCGSGVPGWVAPGSLRSSHRAFTKIRYPFNSSKPLLTAANHARTAVAARSTSSASSTQPDSAAYLVWGLQPTSQPEVHVVVGPQLAVTRIVPLDVDKLRPDLLTKNNFMEFVAKNLISKGAKRQGVEALVLSAAYFPSQLDVMRELAAKQSVGLSVYLNANNGTLHCAFQTLQPAPAIIKDHHQQQQQQQQQRQFSASDNKSALLSSLGPLQPLPYERLQAAQMAEQGLRQQLRLWDPATWSVVLQQQLESGSACNPFLAVRSLMGTPALQAAQRLVEKKGLTWLEVPEDLLQAKAASEGGSTSASKSRSRRRGSTAQSGAGRGDSEAGANWQRQQQQGGGGVVIVISRARHSADELRQLPADTLQKYITDIRLTGGNDSSGSINSSVPAGSRQAPGGAAEAMGLPPPFLSIFGR